MRRLCLTAALSFLAAVGGLTFLMSSQTATAQALPAARASAAAGAGNGYLRGGPRGAVKTSTGQAVDGLMVQLISQKTSIRTTVYTDELGRYEFPVLEAGEYVLRIPRPLEFRAFTREGVRIAGATQLSDIIEERLGDGKLPPAADFLPPVPELLPQLTGAEWLSNMPGSEQEKTAVLKACSVGCHSLDYPFRQGLQVEALPSYPLELSQISKCFSRSNLGSEGMR